MLNRDVYLNMMTEKLLQCIDIHRATHFLQDVALYQKSKKVMDFFKEIKIKVIDWLGNIPDLKPVEKFWAHMKNKFEISPHPEEKDFELLVKETSNK
jgi:transposase